MDAEKGTIISEEFQSPPYSLEPDFAKLGKNFRKGVIQFLDYCKKHAAVAALLTAKGAKVQNNVGNPLLFFGLRSLH